MAQSCTKCADFVRFQIIEKHKGMQSCTYHVPRKVAASTSPLPFIPILERETQTQLSEPAFCPKQVTSDSNLLAAALRNAPLQPVGESTAESFNLPNKTRRHLKHMRYRCQLVDRNRQGQGQAVKTAIVNGDSDLFTV